MLVFTLSLSLCAFSAVHSLGESTKSDAFLINNTKALTRYFSAQCASSPEHHTLVSYKRVSRFSTHYRGKPYLETFLPYFDQFDLDQKLIRYLADVSAVRPNRPLLNRTMEAAVTTQLQDVKYKGAARQITMTAITHTATQSDLSTKAVKCQCFVRSQVFDCFSSKFQQCTDWINSKPHP